MKTLTLGFLCTKDKVVLAMKKRGFGAGKWNGYGGKLQGDETVEDALIREIKEESTVTVLRENLMHQGALDFYFSDKPEWDQRVEIFRIEKRKGEPAETEEMKPAWYTFADVPYGEMWKGDDAWIPKFLEGKIISGKVTFGDGGDKLVSLEIEAK